MVQKLKYYTKSFNQQLTRFGDFRFTSQIIFVFIVLLISWSGVRAIQSNYSLQQQVSELKQQSELTQLQNSTIALQNEYYNSNQYLELSSRQNFGLASPGEKELLVPSSVALSFTQAPPNTANTADLSTITHNQSNYDLWFDFFLHRNTNR